jgi:hypothetical protein
MKLYFVPRTRATRPRWLLEELGVPSILHLANTLKLLEGHPLLVEYVKRHTRRPAVMKAVSA